MKKMFILYYGFFLQDELGSDFGGVIALLQARSFGELLRSISLQRTANSPQLIDISHPRDDPYSWPATWTGCWLWECRVQGGVQKEHVARGC